LRQKIVKPLPLGLRCGALVILKHLGHNGEGRDKYECLCDCGSITTKRRDYFNRASPDGVEKSCGCAAAKATSSRSRRHGQSAVGYEYKCWTSARVRCHGGSEAAAITKEVLRIDESWSDFAQFMRDMGPRPPGSALFVLDPTKGYAPGNCRWEQRSIISHCASMRMDNSSGVRGVCWDKSSGKWVARIVRNKRAIHLGHFENLEDAASMRRQAEVALFMDHQLFARWDSQSHTTENERRKKHLRHKTELSSPISKKGNGKP
jgi:hypothetical protein